MLPVSTFVDGQLQLTQATVRNARLAGEAVADLRALADVRVVAVGAARCGRLTTRATRTAVGLAVALDESPARIDAVPAGTVEPARATWVVPRTSAVRDALERIGSKGSPLEAVPAKSRRVEQNPQLDRVHSGMLTVAPHATRAAHVAAYHRRGRAAQGTAR